ncbi:hypothetical protein SUGI_0855050 [Cryptomeria japonica]|nr:hypothetical protein SUGI_0855050 [Cryptomeria japonica]
MLKQGSGMNNCRAEMGYAISKKYLKMGVTTHAVITALKIGSKELQGITRIEDLVLLENVASTRVLEKEGFSKEGLLRNYVYLKGSLRACFLFSFVIPSAAHRFFFSYHHKLSLALSSSHLLIDIFSYYHSLMQVYSMSLFAFYAF